MSMIMLAVGSVTGNPAPIAGGHRFFDEEDSSRARALGAIQHRALFDRGDPRRNRNHHPRRDETLPPMRPADEILQHCLGDLKIRYDAILEWANRRDRSRRLADHLLGHQPHRVAVLKHAVGPFLDRDDAGLVQTIPSPLMQTSVLHVPRSMPMSTENMPKSESKITRDTPLTPNP
jgi:hypothetical protein